MQPLTTPPAWRVVRPQKLFDVEPERVLAMVRRRLRLMAAIGGVVFLATAVITSLPRPTYLATARVMIEPKRAQVVDATAAPALIPPDSSTIDNQVELLQSRNLVGDVVAALGLLKDPEFNPALRPPGPLRRLEAMVLPPKPPPAAEAAERAARATVDSVSRHLTVRRSGMTSMVDVTFVSHDPQKAARVANAVVQQYMRLQLSTKFDANKQVTDLLSGRLDELRKQVLADDEAVQQFKIANNLLSASGTNLTEQEISNYNQTLAAAKAQVAEDQARLRTAQTQLARGSTGEDVGEALSSPVIQELQVKRAEISARVADLQGRYGDRHPDLRKAKRQLGDVDAQIQEEVSRIISNLQAKAQVSQQRAAAIGASLEGARGALAANNRALVRLNELQRRADASRTLYESYLNRFKETSTQQGLEQADSRLVAYAEVPTGKARPKLSLNLAMSLVLGLCAATAALIIAELAEDGLGTADDVVGRLGAHYLGAVPDLSSVAEGKAAAPALYVVQKPLSAFAEAFRSLRTTLTRARSGKAARVVLFTSALPREGKTTTIACLARAAAMEGNKVVVVDCDLRQRNIKRILGLDVDKGLVELLTGAASLEDVLQVDAASGAHVIPLGEDSSQLPQNALGGEAMDALLERLRATYDLVLIDTAPVLAISDGRVLAEKADAVVFLVRWRKTPLKAADGGLRLIENVGAYVAGVVLTQVDMKQQAACGYGDTSYYYKQYKSYYLS